MHYIKMDLIQFIVILNSAFFICATNLKENKDFENMKEQLKTLSERFAEVEGQNFRLQEKTSILEAALLKQQTHFLKAEEWYKAQIQDLEYQCKDEKSWKAMIEQSLERNSESLENLRTASLHGDDTFIHKRQSEHENPVAFYAGLSNITTYGYGDSIIFDNVSLNLGFHYMPSYGLFRAPYNGIYVFSVTLMTHTTTDTHAAIFINDQPKTWMKLYGHEHEYDTTSQTAVYLLDKGDAVSVKHMETNKAFQGLYTYFSGFLLKETFSSISFVGK